MNESRRDLQIIELRAVGSTLEEIGDAVNLSRERVRQILERHPLVTTPPKNEAAKLARICKRASCSNTLKRNQKDYCSALCRREDAYVEVTCIGGKKKRILKSLMKSRPRYGYFFNRAEYREFRRSIAGPFTTDSIRSMADSRRSQN